MLPLLWLAGCDTDPAPCAAGFARDDLGQCSIDDGDDDTQPDGDTGAAVNWVTLPDDCAAPSPLGTDPVTLLDEVLPGDDGNLYEFLDIELQDGLAWAVGQGGLVVLDAAPGAATVISRGTGDRFHRVEPLDGGYLALTHRDRGLEIVDVRDPAAPVQVTALGDYGWEGLSYRDGRLYVAARDRGVVVLDVTTPSAPALVAEVAGLEAPWELSKVRDGWIYAADQALGAVPIDVSNPDAPVVGEPVDLGGGVLHVTVSGDHLYASAGGLGVVVLDLVDPSVPVPVAWLPTGGSVVMAAVADDLLYAVDHTGLAVWDVTDPGAPAPVGRQETPQFALAVAADDDVAWVGDWTAIESWAVDRQADSPELELASSEVLLSADGGHVETSITNLGGGRLQLAGATTSDERLTVEVSASTLEPGESARVRLGFAADGQPLDATVCLASNDADGPTQTIRVSTGANDPHVGQPAPDFVLPGIDGTSYRLSEQLGHPVMLVYFATW